MTIVTVEGASADILRAVKEPTEVRDSDGAVLGHFTPAGKVEAELYAKARALFDPAETKRRKETERGKGCTIDQVMERLKGLGASECDTR